MDRSANYRRHRDLYLDLASLGVVLAPSVDGFHQLHFGVDNYRLRLDDGRYVISTPEWGHGGCAEGVSGGLDDGPRIEFAPFED